MSRTRSILVAAALAGAVAGCAAAAPCTCPPAATTYWRVPREWLQRVETPAEAAAAHTVRGVPFGELHSEWVNLLSRMQPGDSLWHYSGSRPCPPGERCLRPGEDGYLLLRGCTALRWLSTAATFTR